MSRLLNEQVELNADTRSGAREKPRPRPVIVASEEITSIQQEFISQVSQLFQV